jgi:hypothetical protein
MINKLTIFTLLSFLICLNSNAQTFELSPISAYSINGSVDTYYGKYDLKNGAMFGALLNLEVKEKMFVELSYRRNAADVSRETFSFLGDRFKIGFEHYQIGILKTFSEGKVKPFTQLSLGTTRYFEKEAYGEDSWKLSMNVGTGVKLYFNEVIGIRLQANLLMPMEFDGVGLMCGFDSEGSNCSGNASFDVPIIHLELGGGLIFRISK